MVKRNYLLIGGTHDGRAVQIPDDWHDIVLSKKMRLRVPIQWEEVIPSVLYDCEVYKKVHVHTRLHVYAERNLTFEDMLMLLIDNYRPLGHMI